MRQVCEDLGGGSVGGVGVLRQARAAVSSTEIAREHTDRPYNRSDHNEPV